MFPRHRQASKSLTGLDPSVLHICSPSCTLCIDEVSLAIPSPRSSTSSCSPWPVSSSPLALSLPQFKAHHLLQDLALKPPHSVPLHLFCSYCQGECFWHSIWSYYCLIQSASVTSHFSFLICHARLSWSGPCLLVQTYHLATLPSHFELQQCWTIRHSLNILYAVPLCCCSLVLKCPLSLVYLRRVEQPWCHLVCEVFPNSLSFTHRVLSSTDIGKWILQTTWVSLQAAPWRQASSSIVIICTLYLLLIYKFLEGRDPCLALHRNYVHYHLLNEWMNRG